MDRTMVAWLAVSLMTVAGVAQAAEASHAASTVVVADNAMERTSTTPKRDDTTIDATRAALVDRTRPQAPPNQTSDHFVLLGLGVVFVGVIARQRRRFRRSGTILLR